MRQPLRKVAQRLAAGASIFFGKQAKVVGAAADPLKQFSGVFCLVLSGQTLDQPERARQKTALTAAQAVGGVVAQDQPAAIEFVPDGLRRAQHARVVISDEAHLGQQQ